jgi:probable F420-dependent oxidoreductase
MAADRWGITFPLDGVALPAHRELLREAESIGYTDAWTAEVDGPDAFTPAALAAAWTEQIRIGTAIASVFTRTATVLAQTAWAVADAAQGRFCLGIGASSPAIVQNWNGVAFERPLTRVRETVEFLQQVFAGEKAASASFGVRGFRYSRRHVPPPPIYIAALQEKMLRLAGSMGDGVILNWLAPSDVPKVVAVAKDAARAAGRDPDALDVVARIFVLPATDDNLVRAIGRRAISGYLTTPVYGAFHRWLGRGELLRPMQEAWDAGDRQSATELVPDAAIDDLFVTGDAKECIDKIEAYCANGVTTPVINIMPTAVDPKQLGERNIAVMRELARR